MTARSRGSTLLEVALAVALMAVSGMGLISTQLSLSRHAVSTATRGQAAFFADAFAEMAVEGSSGVGAGEQWKARLSDIVPGGSMSTDALGASTLSATVSWPATPYGSATSGSATSDAGMRVPCVGAPAAPHRQCVSLVFVAR